MEYGLIMKFVDGSENFVHGFECGQVWQKMEAGQAIDKHLIHTVNKKQFELMCYRFCYSFEITRTDDTWSLLTAFKLAN